MCEKYKGSKDISNGRMWHGVPAFKFFAKKFCLELNWGNKIFHALCYWMWHRG